MTKLSVAHITTVSLSLKYLLQNQLLDLKEEGYEVTAVSASGPEVVELEQVGIRHIAIPITRKFTPFADLTTLWRLTTLLKAEDFTIVHTHTPKASAIGQLAARLARVPIVINTVHGFYFHDNMHPVLRRLLIMLERFSAINSDTIFSQSREDVQTALAERIGGPEKIRHLGNGIDLCRFNPRAVDKMLIVTLADELGIDLERPIVGFVGRLVKEKGLLELVQAAKVVLKAEPTVQFLIVGPIDHEKPDALLPSIADEYGVGSSFHFTGIRQDMPELYALMDLFVLPSYREGFPRVPMEASAMGIPSVVTNVRGCREVVAHNETGLLVPVRDVMALANAILSLVTDTEKRLSLGQSARKVAEVRFNEETVFKIVKEEYVRLLQLKGLEVPRAMSDIVS